VVAALLHLQERAGPPVEAVDEVRRGLAHRHDVADQRARHLARGEPAPRLGRSFSALPTTWSTSGMAANAPPDTCAPQPVTTMRASGRSRAAGERSAAPALGLGRDGAGMHDDGAVSPAARACRRITSDSKLLSRQPKVTTSTSSIPTAVQELGRELAAKTWLAGPGHQHRTLARASRSPARRRLR
jgi:hypothetical protein